MKKKNLERKLNIWKELDIGQSSLSGFQAHLNDFPMSESPEKNTTIWLYKLVGTAILKGRIYKNIQIHNSSICLVKDTTQYREKRTKSSSNIIKIINKLYLYYTENISRLSLKQGTGHQVLFQWGNTRN